MPGPTTTWPSPFTPKSCRLVYGRYCVVPQATPWRMCNVAHCVWMHQNEVVSRTQLIEHIYAQDHDRDSNTIEVFIARLRRKIPADHIQTVRGLGYRLQDVAGIVTP